MPGHCTECGRKSTKSGSRTVSEQTKICNECQPHDISNGNRTVTIDPNSKLSDLSFKEFTDWFKTEVEEVVKKKVDEATIEMRKDLEDTKKSVKTAHEKVTELNTKVDTLRTNLKEVTEENSNLRKISGNNLKYLLNMDRNIRRSNVILFGVSETEDLVMVAKGDDEKIEMLLSFIGVHNEVDIRCHTRLGKKTDDDQDQRRPLKIEMKNSEQVSLILINAKKLKPLNQKLFFKPDKTAKEREEYQRLLKRKEELEQAHLTEEPFTEYF